MRLAPTLTALFLAACGASVAPVGSPGPTTSPTTSVSAAPTADVCHVDGATLCALNPAVTQATIGSTICRAGWTKTIRPPVSYTDALKAQQMRELGLSGAASGYEEDHRLPLGLGGDPRNLLNLSPEERSKASLKDSDEALARQHVCAGRLSLLAAQQAFIAKWLAPWPAYKEVQP